MSFECLVSGCQKCVVVSLGGFVSSEVEILQSVAFNTLQVYMTEMVVFIFKQFSYHLMICKSMFLEFESHAINPHLFAFDKK